MVIVLHGPMGIARPIKVAVVGDIVRLSFDDSDHSIQVSRQKLAEALSTESSKISGRDSCSETIWSAVITWTRKGDDGYTVALGTIRKVKVLAEDVRRLRALLEGEIGGRQT